MKKKINIGIIGLGHIANSFHIPAFKSNKNFRISALCDNNKTKLNKYSKKYKIKNIYTNINSMLDDKNNIIDAVAICTPPSLHFKNILTAIKYQKHFFVEKPFTIKNSEAKKIINNLKKKSIVGMCALHQRYRLISKNIKDLIKNKKIGNIYYINIIKRKFRGIPSHSKVFSTKRTSGGGPLIDLGSHYFDLVLWILGYPKIKKVNARVFANLSSKIKNSGIVLPFDSFNNEELAIGNINLKNNTLINFELSYLLNAPKEETKIEFFGEKGSITWPDGQFFIKKNNRFKKNKIKSNGNLIASKLQVEKFKNIIFKPKKDNELNEQILLTKLIDRLYRSAKIKSEIFYE